MYFNSNEVFKLITCQLCHRAFDDPRILPCSHTFCAGCIRSNLLISQDSTIEFECHACDKNHPEVSVSSLPINGLALELIRLKPREVSQNERVKELKEKRALLAEKVGQLKHSLHIGIDEEKNHCSKLKLEIDLKTESRIEELRVINAEMKQKIDDYETKCAQKYDVEQDKLDNEKVLADYDQLKSQTDAYLERFEMTDNETKQLIAQHESMLDEIEISETFLKSNKFISTMIKFKKAEWSYDHSDLGEITLDKCNTDRLDLEESLKHLTTLSDAIGESTTHLIMSINIPGQYFAVYVDKSYRISLARFDSKGEIIKKNVLVDSCVSFKPSCLTESGDKLIVSLNVRPEGDLKTVILNQEICLNGKTNHLLVMLNHDLCYIKHLALNQRSTLTAVNPESVFSLEKKRLVSYSYDLELNYELPIGELIPSNLKHLECNDEKIFILYQKNELMQQLRVVDIKSRSVEKEVDLFRSDFNQIKLFGESHLAVYSNALMMLNIYCQENLNLINTIKLDLPDGEWNLSHDASDKSICLVDLNGKILTAELRIGPEPTAIQDANGTQDQSTAVQSEDA